MKILGKSLLFAILLLFSVFLFSNVSASGNCPPDVILPTLEAGKEYEIDKLIGWCWLAKEKPLNFTYKGQRLFSLKLVNVDNVKIFYRSSTGTFQIFDNVNYDNPTSPTNTFSVTSRGAILIGNLSRNPAQVPGLGTFSILLESGWTSNGLYLQYFSLTLERDFVSKANNKFFPPAPVDPQLNALKRQIDDKLAQIDEKIAEVNRSTSLSAEQRTSLIDSLNAQKQKLLAAKQATEAAEVQRIISDVEKVIGGISLPTGIKTGAIFIEFTNLPDTKSNLTVQVPGIASFLTKFPGNKFIIYGLQAGQQYTVQIFWKGALKETRNLTALEWDKGVLDALP